MNKILQIFKLPEIKNRIFGLDLLRALAILFVIIGHTTILMPNPYSQWLGYFSLDGVTIFFVLSGFLIGRIIIKTLNNHPLNTKTLLNFWTRRWIRTIPNYILVLSVLVAIYGHKVLSISEIIQYFTFTQNLLSPNPNFFQEAWSLSIEEWFYFVIPVILGLKIKLFKLKPKHAVLLTCFLIIIFSNLVRYKTDINIQPQNFIDWDLNIRKMLLTRLDSIMYGVLGSYFSFYHQSIWKKYKSQLLIVGIMTLIIARIISLLNLIPFSSLYYTVIFFNITSISSLMLIPYLNDLKTISSKTIKYVTTHISVTSYSIYLINLTLILNGVNMLIPNQSAILKVLSFLILTFAISTLQYKYFELPVLNLREKFKISKKLN